MRVALVVQRFGAEVGGGAETLARAWAGRLAPRHEVTVLTTTALDYWTWADHYPAGESREGGVRLLRFPVERGREVFRFRWLNQKIRRFPHRDSDELRWVEAQGPTVPALLAYLDEHRDDHDVFVFFTYLYAPTVFGLPRVADRAVFVPTAHDEPPIRFAPFRALFHLPRSILYCSPEERDFVQGRFHNARVASGVAGIGVDLPREGGWNPTGWNAVVLGRVDRFKLGTVLEDFEAFHRTSDRPWRLVLVGRVQVALPRRPWLDVRGYVSEEEKLRILRGARALVVPSEYESLSIALLEGWAEGVPALVNARCAPLRGQVDRSGGGRTYADRRGFAEGLKVLGGDAAGARRMGRAGRAYVAENYSWRRVLGTVERALRAASGAGA